MRKSFFDVRITHANADTNRSKPVQEILNANESAKKREYGDRVREIEHASFTPLVFTTNGAMGEETSRFHRMLADKMCSRSNYTYSETINYIRLRLSSKILRTALIAVRGTRKYNKNRAGVLIKDADMNFIR